MIYVELIKVLWEIKLSFFFCDLWSGRLCMLRSVGGFFYNCIDRVFLSINLILEKN